MNQMHRKLIAGSAPVLLAAGVLAAENATPPATAPATQASTELAPQVASGGNSNEPLVIPDGTSLANPGPPDALPVNAVTGWNGRGIVKGVRG